MNNYFPSYFSLQFEQSKNLPLYISADIGMRIRVAHKMCTLDLDPVDWNTGHGK